MKDPLDTESNLPKGEPRGAYMNTEENLPKTVSLREMAEESSKQPRAVAPAPVVMHPEPNAGASDPGELAGAAREKEMPSS